jgi:hypothetical protein
MRIRALACAMLAAAVPASAQEGSLGIELLPGHPIHHQNEGEAGVAMGLSITAAGGTDLTELCEELRVAAGLTTGNDDELGLETIFVVPRKGMAVEGYYLPRDGTFGKSALVSGKDVAREVLDSIVGRAGIPPRVLDESNVEHEISCDTGEPLWHVVWHDVRLVGDEEPDAVIERAYERFLAIHQSVVEHRTSAQLSRKTHGAATGG